MNKTIIIILIFFLFYNFIVDEVGILGQSEANGPTHYVDDEYSSSTPGWNSTHFNSIQKAIDNADDGDVIQIKKGKYAEAVSINGKTITLVGEEKESTILEGTGKDDPILTLRNVNDACIHELTLQDSQGYGIHLRESSRNHFFDLLITNTTKVGIVLFQNSEGNIIEQNTVSWCGNDGISIGCNNNSIRENNIINNTFDGINVFTAHDNLIQNNMITGNRANGIIIYSSNRTIIQNNSIMHNQEHAINIQGDTNNNLIQENNLMDNKKGIIVWSSSVLIQDNIISGHMSSAGIVLSGPSNVILENTITTNTRGIDIEHDADATVVQQNLFVENSKNAIYIGGAKETIISENTFQGNQNSIRMEPIQHTSDGETTLKIPMQNSIQNNTFTATEDKCIHITGSLNTAITHNIFTGNQEGSINIDRAYFSQNEIIENDFFTISHNNITSNYYTGIILNYCDHTNIIENLIQDNEGNGIKIYYCSNNTLTANNFINNSKSALVLSTNCHDIGIYHNNFINKSNSIEISSFCTNIVFDNGYPSGGNYWSNYQGTDIYWGIEQQQNGSDGIGDTPHIISMRYNDNYPLMGLYVSPLSLTQSKETSTPGFEATLLIISLFIALTIYKRWKL